MEDGSFEAVVKILIADPDRNDASALAGAFESAGYTVSLTDDAKGALIRGTTEVFDLILLEASLPDDTGLSVCRQLRDCGLDIPILMVSSRSDTAAKISGFRYGADDYVTKPFDMDELRERVAALLRRSRNRYSASSLLTELRFGEVSVDFLHGVASKHGAPLLLSAKETRLLHYLASRSPYVVSRAELLTEVWRCLSGQTRTIDMHVAALRRKIEDDPHRPQYILTERGSGYRFHSQAS
jgi:DNA-binding response OmpR family regulator